VQQRLNFELKRLFIASFFRGNGSELVCKPGSVRLHVAIIHLGLTLLPASSNLPENTCGPHD